LIALWRLSHFRPQKNQILSVSGSCRSDEGRKSIADRPTILRASIQRRALALVLPLVIASMLSIGLVSFHTLNKQTAKRSERFLQDRHNEILTISEDQSVASYFHNIAYGLSEEATLYKKELERYFKRFSDRYNSIDQIYVGIRYIDKKGREVAKFWEGRVGGEYHSVIDEAFFQKAIKLPAWTVYTSPVEPRMIKTTPIYWDEDGNGELSHDELRGVIAIDFLYPLVQFRHERLVMWGVTIGITILAIVVTAIAVSMLLRRVTRPLHQLVDATKAISSGDLSTEIAVQSEDEVGVLASSFNQMARDLRATIDEKDRYAGELAKLNVELEDKVRARTRELEATNRELQIANLKIREADRLKSEFLANMSHELRTPMNAIIGFAKLVRRKSADLLPLRQRENLEKVEISANQLLALINDILDLSKIEAGKMSVNIMPFELAPLVDTCFATVESMVKGGRVRLLKEVPDDLPEVLSDQDKLKQIIINLLSNALKFTEEGEVKLSATVEDASLRVAVSDTGIGIPSDALEYIFDEFRQVDGSSTREHGGTGLGLSITRKLTHLLGGTIDVSSVEGEGSTFTVILPLTRRDEEAPAEALRPDEETRASAEMRGKKVLLAIDDDPNVVILLRQNLEDEGYYVVGALNADEGIRKAREIHPFAVTLDILMPQKDGWGVLSDLKVDPATRDIPIIMLSIIDNKELGFSLGAFDYLVKPFDKEAIMAALQRFPRINGKRVLVVDDEPAAVDLLTQILQDEGYQAKGTYSGEEALRALDAAPQDIILLDLLMPEMDGFEVIQRVKANPRWRDIPIIVVTAKDLTDSEWGFLHRSVDRVIQKSGLARENLMKEVQSLLREHDASRKEDRIHEEGPGGGGC
jgi:signal transduction histidine kinase/CheY-like chemotaxis protein